MLTPPFAAGDDILTGGLAAVTPLAAYKYADQNTGTSSGSTTLVNDNDLSLSLGAAGTYVWFGMLVFAATATANFKCTFVAPSGATGGWSPNLYIGTGGAVQTNNAFLSYGTTNAMNCQGTSNNLSNFVGGSVVMGATAGTLQFEFAQNTSDSSNCWSRAGSFLLAWKIA